MMRCVDCVVRSVCPEWLWASPCRQPVDRSTPWSLQHWLHAAGWGCGGCERHGWWERYWHCPVVWYSVCTSAPVLLLSIAVNGLYAVIVYSNAGSNVGHCRAVDWLSDWPAACSGNVSSAVSSWNWIFAAWHQWQVCQFFCYFFVPSVCLCRVCTWRCIKKRGQQ